MREQALHNAGLHMTRTALIWVNERPIIKAPIALLAAGTVGAMHAPPPASLVFACSLGSKQVSVRAVGRELIYRFGTSGRTELSIIGSAARRNVFYWRGRYAGLENQLRFTNGRYSYTVYSLGPNASVGARGVAGLVVRDRGRAVSDLTCRRWTELYSGIFEDWDLPQDNDDMSAISGD